MSNTRARATSSDGLRSSEGLVALASGLLATLALALLIWPMLGGTQQIGGPWMIWGLLEAAFLLPLLPDLLSPSPLVARAAAREAQIAALGRALLWLSLGAALALGADWSLSSLPGHGLALLGAIFALPAALSWGPFGELPGLGPGGQSGFSAATRQLVGRTRVLRAAVLVAATLALTLPLPLLPAIARPALLLGALLLVFLAPGRLIGRWPRLTTLAALRICLLRALPLGLAALLYTALL